MNNKSEKTAWHGLSTDLPKRMSMKSFLKAYGLDWKVNLPKCKTLDETKRHDIILESNGSVIISFNGNKKLMPDTYSYEYTDTFQGESNYSWVKRGEVKAFTSNQAIRLIKKELGLNGIRCNKEDLGDTIKLVPSGSCTVLFIY